MEEMPAEPASKATACHVHAVVITYAQLVPLRVPSPAGPSGLPGPCPRYHVHKPSSGR